MKSKFSHSFEEIISMENLLEAWKEFVKGKRNKKDVADFSLNLMDNIFLLHNDLVYHTYKHGGYQAFKICDPKPRDIHKASVRDRLLHHALYRKLYPFFDRTFIVDAYSCRIGKGTHRAINKFREYSYKVSKNNTRTCWVLKCDIKKFFANIDHGILISILREYIVDENIMRILKNVIGSFLSPNSRILPVVILNDSEGSQLEPVLSMSKDSSSASWRTQNDSNIGLPLGNLTSQLFVNIYMNKFDQFVKHQLKIKYYIRYADDMAILATNHTNLIALMPQIKSFLYNELKLELHPNKISIKTLASGVDFLGWVNFPNYRVLRKSTEKRIFRRIAENPKDESYQSYLGLLKHGNSWKIAQELKNQYFKISWFLVL